MENLNEIGTYFNKSQYNEILRTFKLQALLNLTEDSPYLLTVEDISILLSRSYDYTNREIVSSPNFPQPVKVEKSKGKVRKFFLPSDFIKWRRANIRRIN